MAARPDREAFLRRLEEQQRESIRLKQKDSVEEKTNDENKEEKPVEKEEQITVSKELSGKSNEKITPTYDPDEVKDIQSYLNSCGMANLSIDSIDASSLALLRQLNPLPLKAPSTSESVPKPGDTVEKKKPSLLKPETTKKDESQKQGQVVAEAKSISSPIDSSEQQKSKMEPIIPLKTELPNIDISSSKKLADDLKATDSMIANTEKEINRSANDGVQGLVDRQEKILDIIGRQNDILTTFQNRVNVLEKALIDQQIYTQSLEKALREKHPDIILNLNQPRPLNLQPTTQLERGQPQTPPLGENVRAPPQFPILSFLSGLTFAIISKFSSVVNAIRSFFQGTRMYRIAAAAYREAIRQNIHANLDRYLLLKLLFFVAFFGGRNKDRKDSTSFTGKYRMYILFVTAIFIYLLQTGILSFLYRFCTKEVPGILRNENVQGAEVVDADDNGQRREQRDRRDQVNTAPPQNEVRRGFANGGIERAAVAGGFFKDVKYLVGSFVLSLIPTWRPVVADEEQQAVTGPNAEQPPRLDAAAGRDDNRDVVDE